MKTIIDKCMGVIEKFIRWLLCKVLRLKITDNVFQTITQFIRFGIVGLSNTVISYVIYVVVLLLFQNNNLFVKTDYFIAQFIAFVLSVLWSFFWNRKFVFESEKKKVFWLYALIKTYLSYAFTGLFLNWLLSWVWVELVNMPKLIAPIINLLISVPLNFLLNKFWAFKEIE